MNKVRQYSLTAILCFNAPCVAAQCHLSNDESIMFKDNQERKLCFDISRIDWSDDSALSSFSKNNWQVDTDTDPAAGYWEHWAIESGHDEPIFSQHIMNSYFGLGFWFPKDLEDKEGEMDLDEWIMSHGLLLSVGVGDKKRGKPRFRFDYRWHEETQADMMLQVELPF